MKFYSYLEFISDYSTEDVCLDRIFTEQYGGHELTCPKCGVVDSRFYKLANRKAYSCVNCRYQIHPLAGTIFHKSDTPLAKWLYAIYLFSVSKNGVSAMELQRHLQVTYKTAYRIGKKIRELMQQNIDKLTGIIEMDETYIGGYRRKLQQRSQWSNKSAIVGMTERKGRTVAHVTDANATAALPMLHTYADSNAIINTDDSRIYSRVKRHFAHEFVNHSIKEYVREQVYTNSIEGFWSQLKRSIDGTYHAVSAGQLQRYVDQFVFFYNHRGQQSFPVLFGRAVLQA